MSKSEETILTIDGAGTKYKLNCPDEQYEENIKHSIRLQLPQVWPKEVQDTVIGLVGGGPSLKDSIEDIKQKYEEGMRFVSMNGTHDYLLEHGVRPSVQILVDGRDFNSRFVENWQLKTKYLIASQCHPKVFEALEEAETYIFHAANSVTNLEKIIGDYYMGKAWLLQGGSTVMLRAIPLMRILGYKRMEIFGFDSCVMDDRHHSYSQSENNIGPGRKVTADGREFLAYTWMVNQANDFANLVDTIGDEFEFIIHGDGLIAAMLNEAARKVK